MAPSRRSASVRTRGLTSLQGLLAVLAALVVLGGGTAGESRAQTAAGSTPTVEHAGGAAEASDSIQWSSLSAATERSDGAPVFVYVRASWCGPCYRIEKDVLPEVAEVVESLGPAAKVDVSEAYEGAAGAERWVADWLQHHGLQTPPAFAVIGSGGEVRVLRGYASAAQLESWLARAAHAASR